MKNRIGFVVVFIALIIGVPLSGQNLPVPQSVGKEHPRIFGKNMSRDKVLHLMQKEDWAAGIVKKVKERLQPYLDYCKQDEKWLVSRLQMYWKTKADQVYINGGNYDHAEGNAPAPTVKFIGGRGTKTDHLRPRLEDVLPYMDDPRGLYLQRKGTKDQWEWVPIPATSGITASINREILGLARDASFLYWLEGDVAYAQMAHDILDTYLKGVYYLKEPIDLSHGHHQTLVSYTQFEVIQEHVLNEITQCYDFLYTYIKETSPNNLKLYGATLQKWADLIIKNGVSFNNWNLLQAAHVSKIALVLDDNQYYENGKGGPYYLDVVMNRISTRQWSMQKLIDYGYGPNTGIWNESPGYSLNVLNDFIHFAEFYDHNFDIDLIKELPVLKQAVKSSTQYLYPNAFTVAFGDGHYAHLRPQPFIYLVENAQKYNKPKDEAYFTTLLKTLFNEEVYTGKFVGNNLSDLFSEEELVLQEDVPTGTLTDFTSPLFHAPNTSWLVQRQGSGETGLMISQIGSLGNHMHSNGIAMELYGYGLPLAPEMGHGSSYFSIEYAEYYTQFPAHNTVIVNGKSKYPEMKSNHSFTLNASYPKSGEQDGVFPGYTFSDVSFLEPETNSNQRRIMGIVKTGAELGYYIDIFRSRQNTGNNVKHEYFYHNLGQELILKDAEGVELNLQPTTKMAFGDGDLMAYDYMWDKKSIQTTADITGMFNFTMEDRTVSMNLWLKGENEREVFSAKSPKSTAFRHGPIPEKFNDNPIPTLVVRQDGEAWNRPFAVIYEPVLNGDSKIGSVDYFGENGLTGMQVNHRSGRVDHIFSSADGHTEFQHGNTKFQGTFAVVSQGTSDDFTLFVGNGTSMEFNAYRLSSANSGAMALKFENDGWSIMSQNPCSLTLPISKVKSKYVLSLSTGQEIEGKVDKKAKKVTFSVPEVDFMKFQIKRN